jgi:hypothetical protein
MSDTLREMLDRAVLAKGVSMQEPVVRKRLSLPVLADAPPSFHLLAKPSGSTCNINCTYCFFLSKEALYPNEKSRMSSETLEEYIRQLLESHRSPQVTIAWQGGEPTLMRLDFFKQAVEIANKYRRPDQTILIHFRRMAFFSTTSGARSSKNTTFWSASASTDRANSTTRTGWIAAAKEHLTR